MLSGIGIAQAEKRAMKMAMRTYRAAYVVITQDGTPHAFLTCHKPTKYVHAIVGANQDGSADLVIMNQEKRYDRS